MAPMAPVPKSTGLTEKPRQAVLDALRHRSLDGLVGGISLVARFLYHLDRLGIEEVTPPGGCGGADRQNSENGGDV